MADILGQQIEGVNTPPKKRPFGNDDRGWYCLVPGCSWPGGNFTYSAEVARSHECAQ